MKWPKKAKSRELPQDLASYENLNLPRIKNKERFKKFSEIRIFFKVPL